MPSDKLHFDWLPVYETHFGQNDHPNYVNDRANAFLISDVRGHYGNLNNLSRLRSTSTRRWHGGSNVCVVLRSLNFFQQVLVCSAARLINDVLKL